MISTSYSTVPSSPQPSTRAEAEQPCHPQEAEATEIIGDSPAIQLLRDQVRRLGPHFRTVLLHGETGTGKHLAARALHGFSAHAAGPFVIYRHAPAACGSNQSLYATTDIASLLQDAHRGTLYLDEISAIPREAQADLLAALQRRERTRGPIVVHGLEARLIASTSEDLRVQVATGRFSEQLYRRLSTVEIELPPLRERTEDIPALAAYFLHQQAEPLGRRPLILTDEALEQMQARPWPGNVAELRQQMRTVSAKCASGRIEAHHLRTDATLPEEQEPETKPSPARLQDVVEQHVFQVLKECSGNKVRAAEVLGISRSTLYRMLDSGLQPDRIAGLR
jgi:DNA-binding NtrC family response regulator